VGGWDGTMTPRRKSRVCMPWVTGPGIGPASRLSVSGAGDDNSSIIRRKFDAVLKEKVEGEVVGECRGEPGEGLMPGDRRGDRRGDGLQAGTSMGDGCSQPSAESAAKLSPLLGQGRSAAPGKPSPGSSPVSWSP
jgi:hypothetical protein